ncbi:hypothetical protein BT96DRAFT_644046 [Gymnopus androsaceus JB14]|uniref:Uncharacterized protein n=1 Tax=Gymnopus androsaceus JB14 TaxID=1447944 RepID=A0A6A4GGW4_9AGAR|nr:hypothetical protein BT96DRAFT_644046 [Gymnopus androsaceus JB14]
MASFTVEHCSLASPTKTRAGLPTYSFTFTPFLQALRPVYYLPAKISPCTRLAEPPPQFRVFPPVEQSFRTVLGQFTHLSNNIFATLSMPAVIFDDNLIMTMYLELIGEVRSQLWSSLQDIHARMNNSKWEDGDSDSDVNSLYFTRRSVSSLHWPCRLPVPMNSVLGF